MGYQMHPRELDIERIYLLFTNSYRISTGRTQTREWFERHFWKWRFYGTMSGMVSVRFQRNDLIKLTGAAGTKLGIVKGLQDVLALQQPTWGAISEDMLRQSQKIGFVTPPAWIMRTILGKIGGKITKDRLVKINKNGSFSINLSNIGTVRKYFISNRIYYSWLLKHGPEKFSAEWRQIPASVVLAMKTIAKNHEDTPVRSGFRQRDVATRICGADAPGLARD